MSSKVLIPWSLKALACSLHLSELLWMMTPTTDRELFQEIEQLRSRVVELERADASSPDPESLRLTETLLAVSQAVSSTLDLSEIMRRVARATCRSLGSDMVGAFVPDVEGRALRPIAGYHVPRHLLEDFLAHPIPLKGHRILEEAWEGRRPVWLSDVAGSPEVDREALLRFPHRSNLFFPIIVRDEPVGAFFVAWLHRAHRFTPNEIRFVEAVSHQAALALENARLIEEAERGRREAEASRQRFVDLVQSLDAIVWEADGATCQFTFVSRSAETILGYPAERWLAEPGFMAERLHPDDREATVAACRAAALEARDHQIEYRMVAADGRVVWIHDTVRVVADDRSGARLLRGVKVDITDLKRAEQHREIQLGVTRSLTESESVEEALRKVIEHVGRVLEWELGEIWRVDRDAGLLRRGACWHGSGPDLAEFVDASRGLTLGPGVGLPGRAWSATQPVWVADVGTEPDFARTALAVRAGLHGAFAFPVRTWRGVIGVLVFFNRRVFAPDEHLVKIVEEIGLRLGLFIERKQAEEALARSEQQYRSLVQGAAYGICRTSLDGRFLTVNPALVTMLGYDSEAELLAASLERDIYLRREDRAPIVDDYVRMGRVTGAEAAWRCKDGRVITVRLGGRVLLDPGGEVESLETIVEDVTERRQLEEQFRQAQKMEAIGQLAGGVAHDFNNLLTVILGRSQILLDRLAPDEKAQHAAELIHRTSMRAASLTRQLLAFSRRQVLQPKVLDLDEVVSSMGELLARLIGEHIALAIRRGPGRHLVSADPGQLDQVVMNLAVNARDAMPDGGRLVLATSEAGGAPPAPGHEACRGPCVVLEVTDTGVGMDAETRRRIFEPFFTTKEPGKGTGLGLATVYGIIVQSGGRIAVASEPDRGTTFRICLPSADEGAPAEDAAAAAHAGRLRGSETVLLVEDEEDVRGLARELLEAAGYTVLEAADPHEALRACEAGGGRIHLMLTDVIMPGMSGRELATRAARMRPGMKVLYMSGYAEAPAGGSDLLEQGAALVAKPFTPDSLLDKVRQTLAS